VIPAAFDYVRAESADDAIARLAEHGDDAKLLAGGMSLLPLMKLRLATPTVLVDVGRVRDLSYVRDAGDHVAIGALTRHRDVETNDVLARECAVVRAVAAQVGDNQVRHRGTIGGSVAHGDPASDLPAALLALDATFVVQGPNGTREIAAADFFLGFLETALAPDELLCEIRVPKSGPDGFAFEKFNRRAQDFATVGVVAARSNGSTRVGLINMGSTPLRATAVEQALAQGGSAADAATHAAEGTDPSADLNASVEFREHLARVLVRRALEAL
jgi:carbon-monoxide dehydrogenase medium subunit